MVPMPTTCSWVMPMPSSLMVRCRLRHDGNGDAGLAFDFQQVLVLQALETGPVECVTRVADELAQEDLAVGVQRVRDEVEDLPDIGFEAVGLHDGAPGNLGIVPMRPGTGRPTRRASASGDGVGTSEPTSRARTMLRRAQAGPGPGSACSRGLRPTLRRPPRPRFPAGDPVAGRWSRVRSRLRPQMRRFRLRPP